MTAQRTTPPIQPKQFATRGEIDRAITKLQRRLQEVKDLNPNRDRYDNPELENINHRVRSDILEIFGVNSPEYNRFSRFQVVPSFISFGEDERELQKDFIDGLPRAVSAVEGLIKQLEEKRSDFTQDVDSRVRAAFTDLDLHPRIAGVSADLFRDGHYRNAVLDASVALVNFVKEKSRRHDLDGADLMRKVFSKNNPVLAFNDLKDQSELDEQEGLMHLFEGAVLALRNPRAHQLVPDQPEEALEYIALLSFLAKQVDRAKK